ncbi:unnamed protein product [Candidula unifasciata]|uniref:UDP-glucuronosyltransferase n=1 Tax=Candidula unifasciata TaxID=100452 RepID=A0A8S3YGH6_9EUPU|nr:unnamed protein product [Candidula unifasciata]
MDAQSLLAAILILVSTATNTQAKTILFYPPPPTSYIAYHANVAGALASLGHEVWLCVPHAQLKKNLVTDKIVNILSYGEDLGDIERQLYQTTRILDKFWERQPTQGIHALYPVSQVLLKIVNVLLADKMFLDKVRNLKPDLIVLESVPFNMNMVVLPYMLDIPFAFIGTNHEAIMSKVPFSPAVTPYSIDFLSDRMTFFQKVYLTLCYLVSINFDLYHDSSLVSKFAPHKPHKSIYDIAANAEIFIAEVDHILDYPRTMLPNTKLIGGSSASPAKPLVGEFQKFVDEATTGIIVMSFGGAVVNLPPDISNKIVSAFKQLDLRVVWKINMTSPDPKQIMTSLWIPQNDLLGHQKAKLFVSHCGKNGQYEALYHGVPILCLPIYGDQGYNSERVRVKQLGLYTDIREASADELVALMKEIIYGGKYAENMRKASELYRELYKVPKHEAAYWLDHVIKYGGEYMRSPGQQMPWYQLLVLDVIAFLFLVIVVIVLAFYVLIRICYRLYKGSPQKIKSKRN